MSKPILLAAPISNAFKYWLLNKGFSIVNFEEEDWRQYQSQFVGIITSNKLTLDQQTITQFPALQWIARLGSGMEIIDTDYCRQHHIACFSSPAGIANAVAEHGMGMLLGLLHRIYSSAQEVADSKWIREPNRGIELEDLCVGIIGYGHTGSAMVQKLTAFTKNILVYDKYKEDIPYAATLSHMQQEADIISFHVPLSSETKHYYNEAFASAMQKPHYLINTSRGAVVDTQVILSGLQSGKIKGACLDVLEEEKSIQAVMQSPDNIIQQLLAYPVIITPHIAGYSHNAIEKMSLELQSQLEFMVGDS
jgi:D-3-phosphoglycerate dehydrogenase